MRCIPIPFVFVGFSFLLHGSVIGHYSARTAVIVPLKDRHSARSVLHIRRVRSPSNLTLPTVPQQLQKISNYVDYENERRTLKKKRKRLRQLRDEVRELSLQLSSKGALKEKAIAEAAERRKQKDSSYSRWRRQITQRVRSIMKRLKRLEAGFKHEYNRTQSKETKRLSKQEKLRGLVHTLPVLTTVLPHTLSTSNIKMKRLHSSINQSKSGEPGGVCSTHNDCKPGLCCHRIMSGNGSVHYSCVLHALKEGDSCEDSCQCEARLHCYRNSSPHSSNIPTEAICKKASAEDVLNGVYLDAKSSSFSRNRRRRR